MEALFRFNDLKANKIVNNRTQLARLIAGQGFPRPLALSPNTRAWKKSEIEAWLDSRPRTGAKTT